MVYHGSYKVYNDTDSDLVKAVKQFLFVLGGECYQPGEAKDKARDNLINQLNLEESKLSHNLNAHTYPQYGCEKCSDLLSRLKVMLDNVPGLKGIQTVEGHIGNKYVDYGYLEAVNRVLLIITNPDYKNENTFQVSSKTPYSETLS